MRIARLVCSLVLLTGALTLHIGTASAEVGDAARQACTPDAIRLCGDVIPDVVKVTACMKAKSALLSEPCRVAMRGVGGGHHERHHHYRRARHCHHCG